MTEPDCIGHLDSSTVRRVISRALSREKLAVGLIILGTFLASCKAQQAGLATGTDAGMDGGSAQGMPPVQSDGGPSLPPSDGGGGQTSDGSAPPPSDATASSDRDESSPVTDGGTPGLGDAASDRPGSAMDTTASDLPPGCNNLELPSDVIPAPELYEDINPIVASPSERSEVPFPGRTYALQATYIVVPSGDPKVGMRTAQTFKQYVRVDGDWTLGTGRLDVVTRGPDGAVTRATYAVSHEYSGHTEIKLVCGAAGAGPGYDGFSGQMWIRRQYPREVYLSAIGGALPSRAFVFALVGESPP